MRALTQEASAPASMHAWVRSRRSCSESLASERAMMTRSWSCACVHGGFDFGDKFLARDQADVEAFMAGALGRHLVFDVDGGDAGTVEFL